MYKIFGASGRLNNIENFLDNIKKFSKKYNIEIQVFDADLIYGKNHIISAFNHASRSWKRKKNTTNSLSMEVLLYASGERQLKIALPKMGIKNGMSNIAFILFDKSKVCNNINSEIVDNLLNYLSLKRSDDVLNGDEETLIRFGINRSEIYTVPKEKYKNLILERVAIVDIIK